MSDSRRLPAGFPSDDRRPDRRLVLAGTVLLVAIGGLIGADVWADARAGSSVGHLAVELFVVFLASVGVTVLWTLYLRGRRRNDDLAAELARANDAATRWREEAQEHVAGVSAAIDRQFERWGLTPAEREIALLLLKGLSLKEVAELRGTTERTVRQQSLAIYRKGELAGRAELSAFFLEDLLAGPTHAGPGRS